MSLQHDVVTTWYRYNTMSLQHDVVTTRCRYNTISLQHDVVTTRCRYNTVSLPHDVVTTRCRYNTMSLQHGIVTTRCRYNTMSLRHDVVTTRCRYLLLWWRSVTSHVDGTRTVNDVMINLYKCISIIKLYKYVSYMITTDSPWERDGHQSLSRRDGWRQALSLAGSERSVAIVEATEGREMAPRPGNGRSRQIRGGTGIFVLNGWGSKNLVQGVYYFLEFVEIILYIVKYY